METCNDFQIKKNGLHFKVCDNAQRNRQRKLESKTRNITTLPDCTNLSFTSVE